MAGIAAMSFLSDFMHYKLLLLDGSGLPNSSKNRMVDPTRPLSSIRSKNVKIIRREKFSEVYPKSSAETIVASHASSVYHGAKGKADNSNSQGFALAINLEGWVWIFKYISKESYIVLFYGC